jgi:hypothetical protein
MENKNGGAEKLFQNFGKKVDQFMDELNEAGEKLRKEFEEKYDDLKKTAEHVKTEAENKDRWREVEDNLKRAGEELRKAFQAAFKKREEEKPKES